jgi:flagellar biosynthesis chaperone FliJ
MSPAAFRYQALLEVFENREDVLEQEMANLERERRGAEWRVRDLLQEFERTRRRLASEQKVGDASTALRYLEGVMVRVQASRREEAALQDRILDRMRELRRIRTERMRFARLKDQHHTQVQRFLKRLEQKVSDEFAQRKQTS